MVMINSSQINFCRLHFIEVDEKSDMGVACSCDAPCNSSWTCLKTRLRQSAALRRYSRNGRCICSRPSLLRIRRRRHHLKKIRCNPKTTKTMYCVPTVPSDCDCRYRNKGTITRNDCLICAQNNMRETSCIYMCGEKSPKAECKCCPQDVALKPSKCCFTDKASKSCCISPMDSPELSTGPRNVCRFTVDAYFT